MATTGSLLAFIRSLPEFVTTVMLVGHEPSWSAVLTELIGGGAFRFPTAAMARIDLDVGRWDETRSGVGELRWFVIPRLLDQPG